MFSGRCAIGCRFGILFNGFSGQSIVERRRGRDMTCGLLWSDCSDVLYLYFLLAVQSGSENVYVFDLIYWLLLLVH